MSDGTERKRRRRIWPVVLPVALLGAIVAAAAVGMIGLYVLGSTAAPFRFLADVLPFPAAYVDGQAIRYSEWSEDTRAFVALAEEGKVSIPGAVSRHDIAKNVMDRLVRNRVLERIAKERGIEVTDAEIDKEYASVAGNDADQKTLEAMLKELGWSEVDVKTQIVRPFLLGQRLSERLGSVAAAEKAIADATAAADVKVLVKY